MRRLAVCAFVVLAIGLVLAPGALASTGVKHAPLRVRHAALETRPAAAAGVNFQRLGDTTYSISGHVLDYNGAGVAGAEVDWGWWDSNNNYIFGDTNMPLLTSPGTDSTGAFSFPSVAGGAPNGDDLTVYYNPTLPGLEEMDAWSLNFSTISSYEMQPAHVNVNIANAPASEPVAEVKVGLMNLGYAITDVPGGVGAAGVLPTSFDDVVAYYPHFETRNGPWSVLAEAESLGASPVAVDPGKTAADTVNLDWNNAQYAHLAGPTCQHSGKPGTKVKVILKGWPVGEQAGFVAYYSAGSSLYTAAVVNSSGAGNTYTVPLPIRSNAAVDLYEIDTYRTDAPDSFVDLWDWFQVCTFKASASAIHHGGTVRLSGKVPAGAGYVTVYWRHKAAGQPGTLAAKGWVKGGRYRIKSEKFVSGLLHPTRTTWYVAKYKGFDFSAFTSVIKVTVR
jgi:hypothetical protein